MAQLSKEPVFQRLLLRGINEEDTARFIEQEAGRIPSTEVVESIYALTEGNPFLLTEVVRLLAETGELEELYGANAEAEAITLAHHFAEAMPIVDPERLVHDSIIAGKQALAAHAPEEALVHFERALTTKRGQPADIETAVLQHQLGRAQAAILPGNRMQEAVDNLSRAFGYHVRVGDVDSAIAVAEFPLRTGAGQLAGASELISRALRLVDSDPRRGGFSPGSKAARCLLVAQYPLEQPVCLQASGRLDFITTVLRPGSGDKPL
jgi:hypothetical protein